MHWVPFPFYEFQVCFIKEGTCGTFLYTYDIPQLSQVNVCGQRLAYYHKRCFFLHGIRVGYKKSEFLITFWFSSKHKTSRLNVFLVWHISLYFGMLLSSLGTSNTVLSIRWQKCVLFPRCVLVRVHNNKNNRNQESLKVCSIAFQELRNSGFRI